MKRIAVIGTGYVGLVTGAMFASVGNRVTCVDKDAGIVDMLRRGRCTIHEPGLEEIIGGALADCTLEFSTDIAEAVSTAHAAFIAVGTPSLPSGAYDFRYVEAAAREIGRALTADSRCFVILKSTVTPDIYTRVYSILLEETAGSGARFELLSNPEFLAEGTAVRDFGQPHRVIAGVSSQEARDFMESLYAPFTKSKAGLLQFMDPKSAIVTKLAANSFLGCRVALINEVARYCDAVGADIEHVRTGLACDPRIGHLFLYAGPGYGGSCFGKDIRALRQSAYDHSLELSILPAIEDSNAAHKGYVVQQLKRHFGSIAGKRIAVWGLAFKARTDDVRESPAIDAIASLLEAGATIQAHDPKALARCEERFGERIRYCANKYDALHGADALVIMTEWDTYKSPDYSELAERLGDRLVFDARNILDPDQVRQAGLTYIGMGRCGEFQQSAGAAACQDALMSSFS
jgi:UDPglucose 6-dehydrogenase